MHRNLRSFPATLFFFASLLIGLLAAAPATAADGIYDRKPFSGTREAMRLERFGVPAYYIIHLSHKAKIEVLDPGLEGTYHSFPEDARRSVKCNLIAQSYCRITYGTVNAIAGINTITFTIPDVTTPQFQQLAKQLGHYRILAVLSSGPMTPWGRQMENKYFPGRAITLNDLIGGPTAIEVGESLFYIDADALKQRYENRVQNRRTTYWGADTLVSGELALWVSFQE